jgi:hypothetical protein
VSPNVTQFVVVPIDDVPGYQFEITWTTDDGESWSEECVDFEDVALRMRQTFGCAMFSASDVLLLRQLEDGEDPHLRVIADKMQRISGVKVD